jgi:hypothetical protein
MKWQSQVPFMGWRGVLITNNNKYMDANKFLKIGVGSLLIVIAIYILCLMAVPLIAYYRAVNKAKEAEKTEMVRIDINTGNGMVTVHTGMPKDSVLKILGQPSSSNFGNSFHESCEYDLPGHKRALLDFNDGKLEEVRQY